MQNKKTFLSLILFLGDVFLMYSALLLALALRYGDFSFLPGPQTRVFLYHFSFIALFWFLFLFIFDFYEIPPFKKVFDFFRNLLIFILFAGAFGVIYFYLRPQPIITPKTILVLDVLIFSLFLTGWRYFFSYILKLQNFKEKIVLIGSQSEFKELSPDLLEQNGYEMVASFDPDSSSEISKLKEIIEKEKVNSVVFALNSQRNEDLVKQIFSNLPLRLNFINFPSFYESVAKKVPLEAIDEFWFLENLSRSEKRIEEILKRGFDIFFSAVGLLITAILFSFIALAIKIDSQGSIFYTQKRVGKNGKTFTLYKFRTMKADAEKTGPQWALPNDPRITFVGKILRELYLDEFPQFFNILRGDISFVGPRPERPEFVSGLKKEIPYYDIRHLVKPGFTGWAQINYHYGASVEEAKEKLRYDLYYIKNRNFFLDLGIILKTLRIILK
jgi:exopolysaccharide biosynthesis polyprenyl glycosylphosphotransferase